MANSRQSAPPRLLAPGDVVAAFCERLGEWSAAQVTDLSTDWETAGLLDLDWSGPEPTTVADLGSVTPLRRTHHSWNESLSHVNRSWVLPRNCKVIGTWPVLHTVRSLSYQREWQIGWQLALQRRWDGGDHGPTSDLREITCTGSEINEALGGSSPLRPDVWRLTVRDIEWLDCGRLVVRYPGLTSLSLAGVMGKLQNAASLNRLTSLKALRIYDLFGMSGRDCLVPDQARTLEYLLLHSIPHDYAAAMRRHWRPELPNGTYVDITGARKPEWIVENRENPLREWDGRGHISRSRFQKAVAQYKATRRAVMAALADGVDNQTLLRLAQIGREYAEAFNKLDGTRPFIETDEREELIAALQLIVNDYEAALMEDLSSARDSLVDGVNEARDW